MQFRILHRYIPTNKLLHKMGKIDNPRCLQCNLYIESIKHLFYECICLRPIWFLIEKFISDSIETNIKLCCRDVMLGYDIINNKSIQNVIVNQVILYCKYYICSVNTVVNLLVFQV